MNISAKALRKMLGSKARETLVFPKLTTHELNEIRRKVTQGLAEIERGEAIECENEEELRRFFDDVRTEAYRNLLNKTQKVKNIKGGSRIRACTSHRARL